MMSGFVLTPRAKADIFDIWAYMRLSIPSATARPRGPTAKLQPSPAGLGINPENDLSAVGAALNLCPLPPV
jgi:hypothetical protein